MEAVTDILVLPFSGQGHIIPCVELCKHFSSYNCKSIVIIPSHLSSSIPSNVDRHPLVEVLQIPESHSPFPPPPPHPGAAEPPDVPKGEWSGPGNTPGPKPFHPHHQIPASYSPLPSPSLQPEAAAQLPKGEWSGPGNVPGPGPVHRNHQQLGNGIESFLSERYKKVRPGCVVMDVMMSWSKEIFKKANIPIVSFFTTGACATAMEYAAWKEYADDMGPNETRILSGLPESMALGYSDLRRRDPPQHEHGENKGRRPGGMNLGPPKPRQPPNWMDEAKGSTALLINTCDDLEGPFLKYLTGQIEKPVFGVGPLLPETYWNSNGSVLHDRDSRQNRESNYTEDEVIQWLDSKASRSVIYVSFGSEVGPTLEEFDQLAEALTESNRSFIWVIQPGAGRRGPPASFFGGKTGSSSKEEGYYPHGMEERVGDRGLIIKGWAPQLLILSHPSTGGFLSHCGWNSTVEAIGCGIPILAWPIRGDQFFDAKLVVKYLKVGHMISSGDELPETVKKSDIIQGIEVLMDDAEVHDRAVALRDIFKAGYPSSSTASLKALIELISK